MNTAKWLAASSIISLVALTGCATSEQYDAPLKNWVGEPVSNFIAKSGYAPSQVIYAKNGKIYIFNIPSQSTATTTSGMIVPINESCTWTFRTDQSGKIIQYFWRG